MPDLAEFLSGGNQNPAISSGTRSRFHLGFYSGPNAFGQAISDMTAVARSADVGSASVNTANWMVGFERRQARYLSESRRQLAADPEGYRGVAEETAVLSPSDQRIVEARQKAAQQYTEAAIAYMDATIVENGGNPEWANHLRMQLGAGERSNGEVVPSETYESTARAVHHLLGIDRELDHAHEDVIRLEERLGRGVDSAVEATALRIASTALHIAVAIQQAVDSNLDPDQTQWIRTLAGRGITTNANLLAPLILLVGEALSNMRGLVVAENQYRGLDYIDGVERNLERRRDAALATIATSTERAELDQGNDDL